MHQNTVLQQWLTHRTSGTRSGGATEWRYHLTERNKGLTSDTDRSQPLRCVRVFSVTRIYAFELKPLARLCIIHNTRALSIYGALPDVTSVTPRYSQEQGDVFVFTVMKVFPSVRK
jgi:hypothetical protein